MTLFFQQQKFHRHVKDNEPSELNVGKANRLDDEANYLDLTCHR